MISYVVGDLFESGCEALVNPCNCVGAMGLGIALAYRNKYPSVYGPYRKACRAGNVRLGSVYAIAPTEPDAPNWVVNLPTKGHWYDLSKLEWITDGLRALRHWIIDNKIASIAIPGLGTGNGWLSWDDVIGEIRKELGGLDADIRVYVPADYEVKAMKYAVLYVSTHDNRIGIHGFGFEDLSAARYAKVPHLVTPNGYMPKLTGAQLKDAAYDPVYKYPTGECKPKNPVVKREAAEICFIDGWTDRTDIVTFIEQLDAEHLTIIHDGLKGANLTDKPKDWTVVRKADFKFDPAEHNKSKGPDRDGMLYAIRNLSYSDERLFVSPYKEVEYWDAEKSLHPTLNHKWSYTITSEIGTTIDGADGVHYYEYFLGDHAKSNDDLEVLGKEDPETGFALVWMRESCEILDAIAEYHKEHLWDGKRRYEQYDVINMVNINTLLKPKIQFEVRNFGVEVFEPADYNRRLLSGNGDLVSMCLVPPRISYRILDIRDEYRMILDTYLGSNKIANLLLTDVTDLFYEDGKFSKLYGQTTDMLRFTANNHVGDTRQLQMIRGLDMPLRSVLANSADIIKRVCIVTWPFSERVYRYGMIVDTTESVSLWAAGYSGKMFCL